MIVTIVLSFIALAALLACVFCGTGNVRHYAKLRAARRVYEKIQELEDGQVMAYVRKIDPYVFEELVLLAFRKKGFRTYRNRRYSGDGGVDGKVRINGQTFLIQDKRYSGHINLCHVQEFEKVCRKRHRNGIFIHTGRTGAASRETVTDSDRISIISGSALVDLLRDSKVKR